MPIPDYQTLMLPLLKTLVDGKVHALREVRESLANELQLSDAERQELLPSGAQRVFDNRVSWARTYLKNAELLDYPERGRLKITARGQSVVKQNPPQINVKFLDQFPEFVAFRLAKKEPKADKANHVEEIETPDELIEAAYSRLKAELTAELLSSIKASSPAFFERLVVDLLLKMGYGGSRKEAGQAIGSSGDEGIDGIIKEDRLGLDIIYIQAKRWEPTVGRPEIQKFAGALQGQRARKGVFITTSTFSKEAIDYARMIETKIILVDGLRLAELMMEYGVGVSTVSTYELKKIDSDYFSEL